MFVILGVIILIAAVVVGVAGVFGNLGSGHALTHGFSVFGYHVTGSTGVLFLYGIVVGAAALLGLGLLLAAARRTSRRGHAARRELKYSRRQTQAISRDRDLPGQTESAHSEAARSETARADETARAKTARADEAARSEVARADETARSATARADETARAKAARADETARAKAARADETTRAQQNSPPRGDRDPGQGG
jgi:hypothetical protein